ncbi:MAG: TetR/AcrR family transcriptional regulator [Firmicutes bacterium]|nr:TetR/AcrR family transcriptional regulator [Bacillota bacterium]
MEKQSIQLKNEAVLGGVASVQTDAQTKITRAKAKEITRERILNAAVVLFSRNGFSATSVQDIARGAGISVGLMYNHYKTKEDVFLELVKQALLEIRELKHMLEANECPLVVYTTLCDEIILAFKTSEELSMWFSLLSRPLALGNEEDLTKDFINYHKSFVDVLSAFIKKGQGAGKFKAGCPKKMAQFFKATLQGLCALQLSLKQDFEVPSQEMLMSILVN